MAKSSSEPQMTTLEKAEAAVAFAQQVRRFHRRRSSRTSTQRTLDLKEATKRVQDAMKPIRSEIGRFPYGPQTDQAEQHRQRVRATSLALQSERRKLWKMSTPPKPKTRMY